jgi:hypothetical protein
LIAGSATARGVPLRVQRDEKRKPVHDLSDGVSCSASMRAYADLPVPPTRADLEAYQGVLNDIGARLRLVRDLLGQPMDIAH